MLYEKYELLLNSLLANDHHVVVVGLLPRQTVDLSAYNIKLQQLCDACDTEFVENYDSFLLASGEIAESYYSRDRVHLNNYGTKKLLSIIDKVYRITGQGQSSVRNGSVRTHRSAYRPNGGRSYHPNGDRSRPGYSNRNTSKYCHICVRNGHSTQECWFNGRNEGWSMSQSR